MFCTFLAVAFVGSWFRFWNCSVSSSSRHFSWYLSLFSKCFQIKDQTKFEYKHDIIDLGTCPEDNCPESYIDESGRRISEGIIDHNGRGQ